MWARAYTAIELSRAAAVTTSANRTGVDLTTYADLGRAEMKAVVDLGTFTTVTTCTVSITNSATQNGSYTAPAYGTSTGTYTTAGVKELNFRADLPWIRAEIVVDTTGSVPLSVTATVLKREANS